MVEKNHKVAAIILAAGIGSRFGGEVTKQQVNILGHSVLYHATVAFERCDDVDGIVIVVRPDEIDFAKRETSQMRKIKAIVPGGRCRAESARIGVESASWASVVAIHDAARALVTPKNVSDVIAAARQSGAATAVSAVVDTIKRVDSCGVIISTVDRASLRSAQTPQVFERALYIRALESLRPEESVTDDNMLMEKIGVNVVTVDVGRQNFKITTPEDLCYAEFVLAKRGI